MTNPTYEQALAIVRYHEDIDRANRQGLDLDLGGEVQNLGGNCMALTFGTERGDFVVITSEAVTLWSNENQFNDGDIEPNEYTCVYDIDADNLNMSTPWAISTDADAIRQLAECVYMNIQRLEAPDLYPDIEGEAGHMLRISIEENCAYAMKQLDYGTATILEIY
jgi:hypothetical protein